MPFLIKFILMKTLVLGASENEDRYSNKAIRSLIKHGHEVVAIGNKKGKVLEVNIEKAHPLENLPKDNLNKIDTVTIYLSPQNQEEYLEFILNLNPRRIIFNPGAENAILESMAIKNGILIENACTLVLLSINSY
jgi:uncharacterized protein